MNSQKIRYILIIVVAGLSGYFIGVNKIVFDWHNYQPHIEVTSKEPPPSLMHMDFSMFWGVMDKLENNYYNRTVIDPQKMLNGAIEGMVSSLDDPYTVYLPPVQNNNFKQSMAGQFQGIGAELGLKGKEIIVVAPLDGSPAQKAGLRAGDTILKVDGVSVAGWSLNDTVNKIRGPKGTTVTLTVAHKANAAPVDIPIMRDTITMKSITNWTKQVKDIDGIDTKMQVLQNAANDKIVYIRLAQFGDTASSEWLNMVNTVSGELRTDKNIKGVVLDLRNNPGGYLNDAVYLASEFISSGVAVMEEDKNGERTPYPVSGKGLLTNVPLVVLINKGSASASEIVSGALRDHKRALLIGETSFGKGTIQQAEDLGSGAGLHITIAKWLTPNGTWVGNGKNGTGLTPDISVQLDSKDPSHDTQLEKAVETLIQQ